MPPIEPPPGTVPVYLKGAVLLLTEPEYLAGIRRGKAWRRRVAHLQRSGEPANHDVDPGPTIAGESPSGGGESSPDHATAQQASGGGENGGNP